MGRGLTRSVVIVGSLAGTLGCAPDPDSRDPDALVVAVRSDVGVELHPADGKWHRNLGPAHALGSPAWTPDGDAVVFVAADRSLSVHDVLADKTRSVSTGVRTALLLATTIWNAQLVEQLGKDSKYADEARRVLGEIQGSTQGVALLHRMLERKAALFPHDLRYIGDVEVHRDEAGELRVRAEARLEAPLWDEQ